MALTKTLKRSTDAWRCLNGVFCIYKPPQSALKRIAFEIKDKLCEGLNMLKVRNLDTIVEVRRISTSGQKPRDSILEKEKKVIGVFKEDEDEIEVVKGPSYADNPLVIGPRYQTKDVILKFPIKHGYNTSGLMLVGINGGWRTAKQIYESRWLRGYRVSGRFGIGTDTHFMTGAVCEKATYHKVERRMLEKLLSTIEAGHRNIMIQASGFPPNSEGAYDLVSKGLARPDNDSQQLIYSIKCVDFKLPDFELEIQAINETEEYLSTIIHDIGIKLRSIAVCTKIRCVKFGPLELEMGLLNKHWTLENIINNMTDCEEILKNIDTFNRDPLVKGLSLPNKPESSEYDSFIISNS